MNKNMFFQICSVKNARHLQFLTKKTFKLTHQVGIKLAFIINNSENHLQQRFY